MIEFISGGVTAPSGFMASGVYCGIRKNKTKKDLALIYSEKICTAAGVYTKNKVKGAPIIVTQEHLADGFAKGVICNSGNANTCNPDGYEKAKIMAQAVAKALGDKESDFIVGSTGVIGQPIDVSKIVDGIKPLVAALRVDGSDDAAEAIMTTDLAKKECAVEFYIGDNKVIIGAIAKGSGMINPNMATMLSFITTDCKISSPMLKEALKEVCDKTYNMVSVDGDTSTNDTVTILANGNAGNTEIFEKDENYDVFVSALYVVCENIAKKIAKDGEGATKLIECCVQNCESEEKARIIAKSVIMSSLVKAAFFGADANWGRILCAIGYSNAEVDVTKIDITLVSDKGEILVCKDGGSVNFDEALAKEILLEDEIEIYIDLKEDDKTAIAWGCDLTYDYVKINGDYRT